MVVRALQLSLSLSLSLSHTHTLSLCLSLSLSEQPPHDVPRSTVSVALYTLTYNLSPQPSTLNPAPCTLNPAPCTLNRADVMVQAITGSRSLHGLKMSTPPQNRHLILYYHCH